MLNVTKRAENGATPKDSRKFGRVISIDSRSRNSQARDARQPPTARSAVGSAHPVTQARLAEGLKLHREEMRIAQASREFRLQLEADLAAGGEVEVGDLIYDPELNIVRRNITNAIVSG